MFRRRAFSAPSDFLGDPPLDPTLRQVVVKKKEPFKNIERTSVEPVKATLSISICSEMAAPAVGP